MFKKILIAAALALIPTAAYAIQETVVETEQGEDGPQTVKAIVSKKTASLTRDQWRPTGARKGRAAVAMRTDYDRDGVTDAAVLVSSRRHTAVIVTSGRTGAKRFAWLIDGGVAQDVYIENAGANSISVVFPESTAIDLFDQKGIPMATYLNG